MTTGQFVRPRWLRDLVRFLPLKSQFVLSGNVRDLQAYDIGGGAPAPVSLEVAIGMELRIAGYEHFVAYDPVRGIRSINLPGSDISKTNALLTSAGVQESNGPSPAGHELFGEVLERIVSSSQEPAAVLVDFASRLVARNEALTQPEHQFFSRALVLSHAARLRPSGPQGRAYFNTVVWIVEKEGDLPDWLLVGNPRIRHIPVARPDHVMRRALAPGLLRNLSGGAGAALESMDRAIREFVEQTEGLLLVDLSAIVQLARSEGLGLEKATDAVRRYKVGVTEDPWEKIDRARIKDGTAFIRNRVKGQDHAVTHVLDIVKRAVTGIGSAKRGGRPRGVAFLAGPTGVGKTELAKTITQLLFGDENAYIRFDMSEFSAEHADQRLIGAPPGYVGYDVGGELTNAIREKPFSVVLFDEIEKAHPRILDKFLQILDDGVLTSGRGDRVYFSEAFIIFTSNLGIYRRDASGERVPNVTAEDPLETVQRKVLSEIQDHFKLVLNRPEILNRIGDNIIVFDFIRAEIATGIFDQMIAATISDLATRDIWVEMSDGARAQLRALCLSDLSNGGRGIRNKVEAHLINPLARALFDRDAGAGQSFRLVTVEAGATTTVTLEPLAGRTT
jgi:energy-coupling factor transporter ATP-binding protein EcfA2